MNTLFKLQKYMGKRKLLLPCSLIISGISNLLAILPLIFIWLIIKALWNNQDIADHLLLEQYAIWAVVCAIASVLLYFLALTCSHLAAFKAEVNIRKYSMNKIIKMPIGFFDNNTSGNIRKIIDENASITHTFLAHQMPDLAGTILMPIVAFLLFFIIDWKLGLACMIPLLVSMFLMSKMMNKKGQELMNSYMTSLEDMNTEAVEYVRGIPIVKVFQQTIYSFKNFYNSIMQYKKMVTNYSDICEKPMSAYVTVINSFSFFLVPTAIIIISYGGNTSTTIINCLLYLVVSPIFSQCVMRSMYIFQALNQAQEAIDRVEDLTKTNEIQDPKEPIIPTKNDIEFKDVTFYYEGADKPAIENINLQIKEGETIALVGESGSGKTTIARLIPRFWDTTKGSVCIGNVNIKQMNKKDLMSSISFVFQNAKLFSTSIYENILFGNPKASREDIEKAIDLAQCRDIIDKLPNGLDTVIGTHGTYLSGGEQQRIAIARAILKDAPIVILDEATAFADPDNEELIRQALEKLMENKTVLIIAHRLSIVQNVDCIYVMKSGNIIESGKHNDLIEKKEVYYHMWNEYKKAISWTL